MRTGLKEGAAGTGGIPDTRRTYWE